MPLYAQLQLDLIVRQLIIKPLLEFNEGMRLQLPANGGIYRICDTSANPPLEIYIGISDNLRRRIYSNHFRGSEDNSTLTRKLINGGHFENAVEVHGFLANNCAAQYIEIEDERLRCFVEHYAVAILQPLHND